MASPLGLHPIFRPGQAAKVVTSEALGLSRLLKHREQRLGGGGGGGDFGGQHQPFMGL